MSELERLTQEHCPNGVEYIPLFELFNTRNGYTPSKGNDEFWENGTVPWFRMEDIRENGRILSRATQYVSEKAIKGKLFPENSIIVATSATIGEHALITVPSLANQRFTYLMLKDKYKERFEPKFLYYYCFKLDNYCKECLNQGNFASVDMKRFVKFEFPLVPIEVQSEIVRILDNFTELIEKLTAELTARKKQYDYYREQLINEAEGTSGKLIDLLSQPITDGPHTTPKLVNEGIPFISAGAVWDGKVHFEKAQGFITKEADAEYSRKYKPKRNDVFMVKSGSTTGKVAIVDTDENFNIWSPLAAMRTDNEITARYVYHLLQTTSAQNMVLTRMSHGSQPNLSMRVLEQFDVKIPTLQEQKRIVDILDRFDSLCNDISSGLPAEIEARQKQYEYYRDKLLNFKEMSV